MRSPPYRQPGSDPPLPDKTPVVLTYGPFTLKKDELGKWILDVPPSFENKDLKNLDALVNWAAQTVSNHEYGLQMGVLLNEPHPR
jgi:hypothetical protein